MRKGGVFPPVVTKEILEFLLRSVMCLVKCRGHDDILLKLTIIIRHDLGLDRLVAVLSNNIFKGLPSRLRPFGLQFSIMEALHKDLHASSHSSHVSLASCSLTFWRRIFFLILAHPVFKV